MRGISEYMIDTPPGTSCKNSEGSLLESWVCSTAEPMVTLHTYTNAYD